MGKVRWQLRATMAQRKITNKALGQKMGRHASSIARLKAHDILPEIGGELIEEIRVAISELSLDEFGECALSELVVLDETD
ncbi:hypothetical protein [Vacuolonema iberomarrocanum]|uniref:hypothetical protein n=1 Tax=Vacuolonema iberomarrocanum TaxID=3454632 RepID=UPI001A0FD996|nr:XRE family transcriptional regulator [filamentous cyanobacterium LEGE 07170]